ncbi:hypothetical protein [Salinibacillus xinjiangensis]|uniref:Transporter n=1 Tax=Salinibacillus xinjiangensis TaxID=1229268 RepID=A0A6G1X7H8_9BACI|nr:hypothetical protein [Salinibacillus xinjiangensis]MRG86892.1 hypothetical protein [Salinibacillus xinjiangensis]
MYRQNLPGQISDFFDQFQQQQTPQGPPFGQGSGQFPSFGQGPGQGPGQFPPFGQGPGQGGDQLPPRPPSLPEQAQGGFGSEAQGQFGGGPSIYAVDPGSFQGCLRRLTIVRLTNGRRFWFYPTFIGRRSVAGYRWYPRRWRWVYTGFDTDRVTSFQCY